MQSPRQQPFAVVINNSQRPTNHVLQPRLQALSVDEALQYSPLTTSVSEAYAQILTPQIGRSRNLPRLTTSSERKSVQKAFSTKSSPEIRSKLGVLLDHNDLAEIKFKKSLLLEQASTNRLNGNKNSSSPYEQLSKAARMVLDVTNVDYRYPSPSVPSTPGALSPLSSLLPSLPTPAVSLSPENRSGFNASKLSGQHVITHRNQQFTTPKSNARFSIEVPPLSSTARSELYAEVPDSPKRRKLDFQPQQDMPSIRVRAQKEIADAAVAQFQNFLLEIFEAEDQLEPDTSLSAEAKSSAFFDTPATSDNNVQPTLSTQVQDKLQASIKQLIKCERFGDISSDHVARLQSLCENQVDVGQSVFPELSHDLGDEKVEHWRSCIAQAAKCVSTTCTAVWTMIGKAHEEQLVSGELIRWARTGLANVVENCLIPVVEARSSGKTETLFACAASAKQELQGLTNQTKKLLDALSRLCVQVKGAEDANDMFFLAIDLVFAENAGHEKDSVLGLQAFEKLRKAAMGAVAQIFARFPTERRNILERILTSLDKLPVTSRNARQYKVISGKNIQLISALIMQLVQTAASSSPERSISRRVQIFGQDSDNEEKSDEDEGVTTLNGDLAEAIPTDGTPLEQLHDLVRNSYDNAAKCAQTVVNHLVSKASTSAKTGNDKNNYRNLLDLFVEDVMIVLDQAEWPASELLLRILAARMIDIARSDNTARAQNMALELLGNMGSKISKLRASVETSTAATARHTGSTISEHLSKLAEDQKRGGIRTQDLIAENGPFSIALKSLSTSDSESLNRRSARGFIVSHWAKLLCRLIENETTSETTTSGRAHDGLVELLLGQMSAPAEFNYVGLDFPDLSVVENKLAHMLGVLSQGFCLRFGDIVKTLLASFASEQAQIRSRSMKSVITILETDSSLLDRDATIVDDIFRCVSDDSSLVRDAALNMLAKIVVWKPALRDKVLRHILACTEDSRLKVQKTSMALLKDIYLRETRADLQAALAEALLKRIGDVEESITDLAIRTLMDIWILPNLDLLSSVEDIARSRTTIDELTLVLVKTVARNPTDLASMAKTFFKKALMEAKTVEKTLNLYRVIAASLFDLAVADADILSTSVDKQAVLLLLVVIAKSNARVVSPEQLKSLRPYLGNLAKDEDLLLFRPVVALFRSVLPQLSSSYRVFLEEIQQDMLKLVARFQRRLELDEVLSCIWAINPLVESTGKLVSLTVSVLNGLLATNIITKAEYKPGDVEQEKALARKRNFVRIIGSIGKHFDLENYLSHFQAKIPKFEGSSLVDFMTDVVCPLTSEHQLPLLRANSLEALGSICQSWPGQFRRRSVCNAFLKVFHEKDGEVVVQVSPSKHDRTVRSVELQSVVLKGFLDLLHLREDTKREPGDGEDDSDQKLSHLGGNAKTGDHDSAVGLIAHNFLKPILDMAIARQDENALIAVRLLSSISRQGLIHPRECAGALVALGTSSDPAIAAEGFAIHQMLHQQHESVYERQYAAAVKEAFTYQKDVAGDTSGAYQSPYKAKLGKCFDLVKTGATKSVKAFLSNMVLCCNFELARVDTSKGLSDHVLLTGFIMQNLAFFEYGKMDELLHLILQLEVVFGKTGAEVSQTIDARLGVQQPTVTADGITMTEDGSDHVRDLSAERIESRGLVSLADAATAMILLWETRKYLKRQYGITQDVRQALQQVKQAKEGGKTPLKVPGIYGEKYWSLTTSLTTSSSDTESLLARCREFLTLMNVDDDVKIAADDDDMRNGMSASVDLEDDARRQSVGFQPSKKRKSTGSITGTPKKRRARPSKSAARRESTSSRDDPHADFDEDE